MSEFKCKKGDLVWYKPFGFDETETIVPDVYAVREWDLAVYREPEDVERFIELLIAKRLASLEPLSRLLYRKIQSGELRIFERVWKRDEEKQPITIKEGETVTTADGRKLKLVEVEG